MKRNSFKLFAILITLSVFFTGNLVSQELDFTAVRAVVDFSKPLQEWDGFGFNYVECAHTYNYDIFRQEYGGFSLLDEQEKQEIIDLIFGEDGLKPGLVKMFLDAIHQTEPGGTFDHETTTGNMRYFVREGLQLTRERGDDLTIITTLYGPPGYMTLQKVPRGRDLDPNHEKDMARYMIDWVKYLVEEEKFPVKYISLHNEGESWLRWNTRGITDNPGHDYNLFWPPEQVVKYLKMMPPMLKKAGLSNIGVTPGECTNWYRFSTWGYADAIYDDEEALYNMALITSHGFYGGGYGRWFGEHKSAGNDILREKRPELHSWVTSTSWSKMDANNIKEMHGNIYTAKVNGIIPWAGIQRPPHWVGGDPNPGCAIYVFEDGTYEVRRGYYFYKQISRAGQPGMAVVRTSAMDSEISVIGFGSNGTKNPNAFIVTNTSNHTRKIYIYVKGTDDKLFTAYRTLEENNRYENLDNEWYANIGEYIAENGGIKYVAPPGSVTTFFAQ